MKNLYKLFFCMILTFASILFCMSAYAQGEVTRSGSTWSARVNGNTVYTGSRMFDAVNAACNNMGAGTINIRNSGDSGPDGGNVYAIRPRANQTLDFHGHTVNCNGGDLVVVVHADRRDGITVRNLHVTGNPRYGLWFRGSSNVSISNITMNLSNNNPVGLGIRVDASTGPANNLTISGNINISGAAGHAVETYGVDGFSIGNITANNTGGCGLLLNDSRNGTVGVVTGSYNNQGGGYATFRVANNNGPNVSVEGVYSRNSGRGFFSVSGSHGTTIGWVDIANTSSHGIFLEDASNTHVLSGSVSNGNPNCQEVRTTSSTINVSGCGGSGGGGEPSCGTCGSGIVNNGVYRITPRHATSKALELYNFSSSNGTNINQWEYWGGEYQHWRAVDRGNGYWSFHPVTASGRAMDVANISTANGANIALWDYWAGDGQQWYFSNAGSGGWVRIMSRLSGKCVDVVGSGDGANVEQWTCQSGFQNQMFRFEPVSGGSSYSNDQSKKLFSKQGNGVNISVFPNPASDAVNIDFLSAPTVPATIKLTNLTGQAVYNTVVTGNAYVMDVTSFPKGIYILSIEYGEENMMQKIVLE